MMNSPDDLQKILYLFKKYAIAPIVFLMKLITDSNHF